MSKNILKMKCTSEVATAKYIMEMQNQGGHYPQVGLINDFIKSGHGLYQAALKLINPGSLASLENNPGVKEVENKSGLKQGYWEMLAYRPSEVLGHIEDGAFIDDILEIYSDMLDGFYKPEGEQAEKITFTKAIKQALAYDKKTGLFKQGSELDVYNDTLEDLKLDEPATYEYFKQWMESLHHRPKSDDWGGRVREALLKNSISGAVLNSTQLFVTVLPNSTVQDTLKGIELFINDKQSGYKELKSQGIGERSHFEEVKGKKDFDVFQLPERYNQGIAYYIGKAEALRNNPNLSEDQAQKAGLKFNEKVNFIPRPGNVPRAYWNENTKNALTLLSYSIQYNKMYWGSVKNLITGNVEAKKKAAGYLLKSTLITSLMFGANAAIPAPIWALLGNDDDENNILNKKFWVKLSQFSLFQGLLGIDLSGQLKAGDIRNFTPVTFGSIQQAYDTFEQLFTKIKKDIEEDDLEDISSPKTLTKFANLAQKGLIVGAMMNPQIAKIIGVTKFGGGQLGEFLVTGTRIATGNYERTDWGTKKKYETTPSEELIRIIGKPVSEIKKVYGLE